LRFLVLSDIHSNLEALTAVLADAEDKQIDSIVCLGDFVGYGANPDECVQTIASVPNATAVLGNHDAAVIDSDQRELFNPVAKAGILYSESRLGEDSKAYLSGLPLVIESPPNFIAVHSSPFRPEGWVYVIEPSDAADAFYSMRQTLAFIGHTHFPVVHADNGSVIPFLPGDRVKVDEKQKIMINVGSVGQPRDGDARAAYVVYDSGQKAASIFRVHYDIDRAAAKIIEAGLPPMLAARLRRGY